MQKFTFLFEIEWQGEPVAVVDLGQLSGDDNKQPPPPPPPAHPHIPLEIKVPISEVSLVREIP